MLLRCTAHTSDCASSIAGSSLCKQQFCQASVVCSGSVNERRGAIQCSLICISSMLKQDLGNFIIFLHHRRLC